MSGTKAQDEFRHLLGVGNERGFTLMNPDPGTRHLTMTAEDFNWTCGREVTAQRRQARKTTVIEDRERGWRRREIDTCSRAVATRSTRLELLESRGGSHNKNYGFRRKKSVLVAACRHSCDGIPARNYVC